MSEKKTHPLFVIDQSGTVKWPVIVKIPADGGEFAAFQFTGVFKRLTEDEYDAIMKPQLVVDQNDIVPGKSRAAVIAENAELFPQLMTGWEDVRDAQGATVPFSVEVLRQQIVGANGTHLSIGLWQAVHEIRNGARLGN
jgi:hypothetical protein